MGASALLIIFLKTFKKLISTFFAAIVILFYEDSDTSINSILTKTAISFAAIVGISLLIAFLKYFPLKFHIHNDKLIFSRDLIGKKTTSIPTANIHTTRTHRGLIYQLLNVRGISFDTIATSEEELELILSEKDWQQLQLDIQNSERYVETKGLTVPPPMPKAEKSISVSNIDLIKGVLCQNHLRGLAILAALLFTIADNIYEIDKNASEQAFNFVETHAGSLIPSPVGVLISLVILYICVALLWVGKNVLKYGNLSITEARDRVVLKCGLLSRFTIRLARDKVTIITIKQNPLEKALQNHTVDIRQALNIAAQKEEQEAKIYGSLIGDDILKWWLGSHVPDEGEKPLTARSGIGIFYRRLIPHLILAAIIGCALCYYGQIVLAAILCTAYAAIAAARAVMAWKHSSIVLDNRFIKINNGNIAHISSYIKYSSIESVRIRQTPLTRYTRRVSLSIGTNAGNLSIGSLNEAEALGIRNVILNHAE